MCFDFLYTTFVWNISHSKKNWVRFYRKCTFVDWSLYTCLDMYNLLHKEQLHVSALFIGHLQVDKWETLVSSYTRLLWVVYSGVVRGGVGTRSVWLLTNVSHVSTWRWPMKRAETCSCPLCNKLYISLPPYSCVRQVYTLQSSLL